MLEWRGLKRAFFDDIPAAYLKTKPSMTCPFLRTDTDGMKSKP